MFTKFSDFNLKSELLKAIEELGFEKPSEIQEQTIPILLNQDVDFVGQAQTGTGKTVAFVLPLLQKLNANNKQIQALILTPTRELANQVHQEIEKVGKFSRLSSVAIFGGTPYPKQVLAIQKEKPQIIVGTPGRVIDLINQGVLKLQEVSQVILDEADEMLNMGFLDDVQEILSAIKGERRLWMFSATMPRPILNLINKEFKNPHIVRVEKKGLSAENIEQLYYVVQRKKQLEALCRILDVHHEMYAIIFCGTRQETRDVSEKLIERGYRVETLHGEMTQGARDLAMASFKSRKVSLLVCTDVAARGIDVNCLTHVINFGLPRNSESYVHRIGRTGRAGLSGVAISIVEPGMEWQIRNVENFTKGKLVRSFLPTPAMLKKNLVEKALDEVSSLTSTVVEKGEEFILDETFEIFREKFECLNKHEILKTMFAWKFNKLIKRYDQVAMLDELPQQKNRKRSGGGRSNSSSYSERRGRRFGR